MYLIFSLNVSSSNETKLINDNGVAATLAIHNDAAATLAVVIQKDTNIEDDGDYSPSEYAYAACLALVINLLSV
jgi:hypothetical protein